MSKVKKRKPKKSKIKGPLLTSKSTLTEKDLTNSQRKATELFDAWYRGDKRGKRILRIGGNQGTGKSEAVDNIVPTPSGPKRFGDLRVGDYLFDLYGDLTKVIGIYPQGVQPTYKVTFDDGRYTLCNEEHIWTTVTDKGYFKERTLGEMMKDYALPGKGGSAKHKYVIPQCPVIKYDERPVDLDPYVLGALIGNGCLTEHGLTISSGNMYVPKEVARCLGAVTNIRRHDGYSYRFYDPTGESTQTKNGMKGLKTRDVLASYPELIGAKSAHKFIPDDYKYNSVSVRMHLLQGLLDTDGHVDDQKGRVSYSTTSTRLKNDIIELARSLGLKASATDDGRYDRYTSGICWRISISCPNAVKRLLFRANLKSIGRLKHASSRKLAYELKYQLRLTDIEYVGEMEQMCIMVDNPDHIYITNGFIPTHNTTWVKYLVDKYGFDAHECYVLSYTGQAVNRLRKDGVMARTIHSTIMHTIDEQVCDKNGNPIYKRGVPLMRVVFRPISRLPSSVKLVIVDEASFLPKHLEDTLLRYNVPILETGDPRQLPPVSGVQVFNEDNVDFTMTDVVRQHRDSELYDFISKVRNGINVNTHDYHDEVLFLHQQPTLEETFYRYLPFFKNADVIIVATNKARQVITDLYRKVILKTNSPYPIEGERMICRQNNPQLFIDQYMLTNGMQGRCLNAVGRSLVDESAKIFYMDFQPDVTDGIKSSNDTYFSNLPCSIERLMAPFGSINLEAKFATPGESFEYAHALTVHAMQGSEAPNVLYVDSYSGNLDYLMRLRYVAVSRTTKHLTYLIPYSRYGNWFDLEHIEERTAREREAREQQALERALRIGNLELTINPRKVPFPSIYDQGGLLR